MQSFSKGQSTSHNGTKTPAPDITLHSLLLKQNVPVTPLLITLCLNIFNTFSIHVNMFILLYICSLFIIVTYALLNYNVLSVINFLLVND